MPNPILSPEDLPRADAIRLNDPPCVHKTKKSNAKREIRDLRRKQSAVDALSGLDHETEIYGFTKGQFSIIDILTAALDITGPASLLVSTWTAAKVDVTCVFDLMAKGDIMSARWLVDLTFQRRTPHLADQIRTTFGPDCVRVAQNHAKFAILKNDRWSLFIATSMNLNFNPRFENFLIRHDPDICQFHADVFDEIWHKQKLRMASERPYEIQKHFLEDL